MYRSGLQEFCHQKRWALPKYSYMKHGPDHNPHFKASVVVCGINFETPTFCKSSKQAYNEAAKLAFLHFTSGPSDASREDLVPKQESSLQRPRVHSNPSEKQQQQDVPHGLFKMKLQIFAQRNNLGVPSYHCKREGPGLGPPHRLCFKATVAVGGESFDCPELHTNSEDAENAAAQAALLSLATDAIQGKNTNMFKILLQEHARDKGLFSPRYSSSRSGNDHDPIFKSAVEVEGETFLGNAAKSKKQAELNAAMVAYTALVAHGSSQTREVPQKSSGNSLSTILSPHQEAIAHSPPLDTANVTGDDKSSASLEILDSLLCDEHQSSSAVMVLPNLTSLSVSDSCSRESSETKRYLLCDRVKVYTCISDIYLPKGTILLPIGESKWVAASLEFPNEMV